MLTKYLKKIRFKKLKKTCFADEVHFKINGIKHYLYRYIDTSGNFVDCYFSNKRDTHAFMVVFKKCRKTAKIIPSKIITDGYICYPLAIDAVFGNKGKHIVVKPSLNYIEQVHRWIQQRTRSFVGLKNLDSTRRFCSLFEALKNYFRVQSFKNQFVSAGTRRQIFISRFYFLMEWFVGGKLS